MFIAFIAFLGFTYLLGPYLPLLSPDSWIPYSSFCILYSWFTQLSCWAAEAAEGGAATLGLRCLLFLLAGFSLRPSACSAS